MLNDYDRFIIDEAWESVFFKKCLDADVRALNEEKYDFLSKLCILFSSLTRCDDLAYGLDLIQKSEFKQEEKCYIRELFESNCKTKKPLWSIDVIVGNSLCRKSFHPKVKLSLGEHIVEMDATNFGKLRYNVAQALQRMDSYN